MPNPDTALPEALSRKLRQEAEKRLKSLSDSSEQPPPGDIDYKKIVEELKFQQSELEIQNDDADSARTELDAAINSYKDLYDFAPVTYLTLSDKGVILDVNQPGVTLLKMDRSLLIGSPFLLQIKPDNHLTFIVFIRDILEKNSMRQCDLELECAQQPFWVHMEGVCTALVKKTDERQIRLAVMDITEHIHANTGSLQAHKMEAIGTLAGDIAHDLNNLLAVIQGRASIMLMGIDSKDHPFCEDLKEIETCVDKASNLTRQLRSSRPISMN